MGVAALRDRTGAIGFGTSSAGGATESCRTTG